MKLFRASNNFLTTFNSNARLEKKRERERGDLQSGLHLFHREQKAQDKPDNLAAKPFFLGIISSSSLLSRPSRARNVAQPSSHFLQTIPTSCLSLASTDPRRFSPLFRSLARTLVQHCGSLSGTPEVWSDRQRGPRG